MKIILADLGHNQLTYSSDIYPLGVANLATYVQEYLRPKNRVDIQIVREPEDLKRLLDAGGADVLGLSSYSWNHQLSLHFARYAKGAAPGILTLMGGPNFPLTAPEQESFLRGMADVDVAVRGPTYEGERAFLNIVRRFDEVDCRREGIFEAPVAGNMWIDRRTDRFVDGGPVERINDLDEIPSPYLKGWMDAYFATGYFPMMQIARGCPFSCQFCNSAVKENSRIYAHSVQNVKDDLLYIAERIKPEITLCFADDNFGMYERDEEIADFIGFLQKSYGWPRYIRTTTGKNQAERIIRVMRKAGGVLPMTSAVQSLNPVVLKNIKRDNIKLETYSRIQKELQEQGMQSYGELILCMPGETRASFMKAVHDLIESGVKRVSAHQLMLLHGAPLSNPESRQQFGFKTRFRVVARNLGDYTGAPVIETEEMVVETPDFSFEDYLKTRVFHLLLTIYFYEGNFDEAFEIAKQHGIKAYDLVVKMQEMLDGAPAAFRKVIDDFVQESQEELHPTEAACLEWSRRNFPSLVDGSLGGNLLSKYSMLGRFFVEQEAIEFMHDAIAELLCDRREADDLSQLDAVMDYLRAVMLHSPFDQSLRQTPRWRTDYDIEAWANDKYVKVLDAYRFDMTQMFSTYVPEDRAALIRTKIKTFGDHAQGLGKFTRTMFAREMRRALVREAAAAPAAEPALV